MHHPVTVRVGKSSLSSLVTTVMPPFLGTHWIGLTHELSEIGIAMAFFQYNLVHTNGRADSLEICHSPAYCFLIL
ncbi:hypothetical protein V6N11_035511 [Hibiscus sabdariffa]|uniref:Uncharacterized protein n=1 Tax=Hibiscus sabdariffa TaxID=183260 RepID=A0ABR2R122_9ROSI